MIPKTVLHFRFKNQILCDLHFADVALMECSDFMQQLRSFKPQSLGCAVARRKSSTTLIFPLPPQACSGKYCHRDTVGNILSLSYHRAAFSQTRPMPPTFGRVHMYEMKLQVVPPVFRIIRARLYVRSYFRHTEFE